MSALRKLAVQSAAEFRKTAVGALSKNPVATLKSLRRAATAFAAEQPQTVDPDTAAAHLAKIEAAAGDIQNAVLAHHMDSFDVNWLTARYLHRVGKFQDAFLHFERVLEFEPKNPRVLARYVQALMDAHAEYPNKMYDRKAVELAREAETVEGSEFTWDLLQKAEALMFEKMHAEALTKPKLSLVVG